MKKNKNDIMFLNKHNTMVKAKYNLNVSELRVYLFILHSIQKEIEINKDSKKIKIYDDYITFTVERINFLNAVASKQYIEMNQLKKVFEGLRMKPVYYEIEKDNGKKDWSVFGFILKYSYDSSTDSYKIAIDKLLYDMIVTYKTFGYTSLNLALMFTLEGVYSYRLYELLRLWSNTKQVINYSVNEIKEYLMLDGKKSYNTYANFKNKVIIPAIKELNQLNLFEIDIEEQKLGRKVESINFIVKDLDKRIYLNKKESKSIIELGQKDFTAITSESSSNKKTSDDFYIPNKKLFTAKTLENFKTDFKSYDFKDSTYKKLLQEAILATLEKDDEEKIKVKSYNYFKKTLENKLNDYFENQSKKVNNSKNETVYKKTKFHNFDETFTQYESNELNKIIEKSQDEKFRDRDDKNNSENFEHHAYNKCVEFNWDMSIKTVQISYQQAIKYAMEKGLYYPKNINELK